MYGETYQHHRKFHPIRSHSYIPMATYMYHGHTRAVYDIVCNLLLSTHLHSCKEMMKVLTLVSISIFRFRDEKDYEYKIWLNVFLRIVEKPQ